jgi:hypothetical protein
VNRDPKAVEIDISSLQLDQYFSFQCLDWSWQAGSAYPEEFWSAYVCLASVHYLCSAGRLGKHEREGSGMPGRWKEKAAD